MTDTDPRVRICPETDVQCGRTPCGECPRAAHPDAAELISIADLMPRLSGADPAMLANVGHYLRGLSDRVKVLPVARTGPLRVAAEAESGAVEAVPQACGHPRWLALQSVESDTVLCELCEMRQQRDDAVLMEQELQETVKQLSRALAEVIDSPTHMGEPVLPYRSKRGECAACEERFRALQSRLAEEKAALATTPPQAEPSLAQQLQNAREDFAAMKALAESGAAEIARLTAEPAGGGAFKIALAVAKLAPSSGRVVINASALLSLDEELSEKFDEIARLTAELAQANAMCESLAASVQDLANAKAAVDEAHSIELAAAPEAPKP